MARTLYSLNTSNASHQTAKSLSATGKVANLLKSFVCFGNKKPRRHRVNGEGGDFDSIQNYRNANRFSCLTSIHKNNIFL